MKAPRLASSNRQRFVKSLRFHEPRLARYMNGMAAKQGDAEPGPEQLKARPDVGDFDGDPSVDAGGVEGVVDRRADSPSRREVNEGGF
jgi:hypothetical protein